jgi:hypothetical protein
LFVPNNRYINVIKESRPIAEPAIPVNSSESGQQSLYTNSETQELEELAHLAVR